MSPVHIHALLCSVVERTLYSVHLIAVASEVCACVLFCHGERIQQSPTTLNYGRPHMEA